MLFKINENKNSKQMSVTRIEPGAFGSLVRFATDRSTRMHSFNGRNNLFKQRKYALRTLGNLLSFSESRTYSLLFGQMNNFINRCYKILDVTVNCDINSNNFQIDDRIL